MADLEDIDNTAPADSLYEGGVKINLIRTRVDALYTVLSSITSAEADQIEAIGTSTISAAQWGYLGALNQGLTTTSTVTFGTINAFTLGGKLTAGAVEIEGSAFDINGGTIDGITSLTAGGALDIGAYGFRANTLTADGLTATRVVFAGANGLLSDAAAMTFVTDTLTVTKLGAFQAAGAINFDSQNMTNVDIDSGTINGITDLAVVDGGTGASDATNARSNLGLVIGTNVLAEQTIGIADDNLVEIDHADNGGVADNDYAKFTANGLEGREASEVLTDLGLDSGLANLTTAEVDQLEAIGTATISAAQWGYLGACAAGGGQLLAALTAGESTQLEAIGTTEISAAEWGYLGACGAGGGQLLAALTTGESDQLELIGATTISAAQWGYVGALTTDPIGGDGTAGRILRGSYLQIADGSNVDTLKCILHNRWNGDAIVVQDNIAKGATTGHYTLDANGFALVIEATGLIGNVVYAVGYLIINSTGVDLIGYVYAVGNDIRVALTASTTGISQDITALTDLGGGAMYLEFFYLTDA